MGRSVAVALLVLVMVVVIVVVDLLFLRDHVWLRLLVNIGIVAVFGATYFALRDRL